MLRLNPPKTLEDWMLLLRKQESLHSMEVHEWNKVLRSAVILLKKVLFLFFWGGEGAYQFVASRSYLKPENRLVSSM